MTVEINHHERKLAGLRAPLRLIQLSDLHFGPYVKEAQLEHWCDLALELEGDLIVITGDFVDRYLRTGLEPLQRHLGRLQAPLGVWGIWGNHDWGRYAGEGLEPLRHSLDEAGVKVLINAGKQLRDDLFLAGIDDYQQGNFDPEAAFARRPDEGACLALLHDPAKADALPAGCDLLLCGHTHGGQVRLPLVGSLLSDLYHQHAIVSGWLERDPATYVSRGLGVTLLPFRLNCPPEIAVFNLKPTG